MNDFKKEMEKAYQKGTQKAAEKQDEVWAGISRKMEEQKVSRNKKSRIGLIIAAAAAALVVLTAFTPAGQAAVSKIIDLFAPSKDVKIDMEGMVEENEYQLHTPEITKTESTDAANEEEAVTENQAMTYAMYIDGSRYSAETVDGVDWIKPLNYPENYPEVRMSIYQVKDKSPLEIARALEKEMPEKYDTVYEPEKVESPVSSIHVYAHEGFSEGEKEDLPQWDSKVIDIYLVDNTQEGTFVITLEYFMEASEGHAQRYKDMLRDFTVIPMQ